MNQICKELNQQQYTSKHNSKNYYSIETTSKLRLVTLQNYLNTYPLFTSKYFNFLDWSNGLNILLKDEHLKEPGKSIILNLKNGKNRSRTTIQDW